MNCDGGAQLSRVRAAAGKAGMAARWGKRRDTKTVRVFAKDAAILERRASASGQRLADVVHAILGRHSRH